MTRSWVSSTAPRPTRMGGRGCSGTGWGADQPLARFFFGAAFRFAGAFLAAVFFLGVAAFFRVGARFCSEAEDLRFFAGAACFFAPGAGAEVSTADQSTVLVTSMPAGRGTLANRQRSRIWIFVLS